MDPAKYATVQKTFVVIALVIFAASLIVAYLNTAAIEPLFYNTNDYVDSKYYQEVSPIGTAFGIIWPIIYMWNTAGILYIAISMCLPTRKSPVNIQPTLIPISFLVFHTLGFGSTLGWLFAFDREILELSLALLILSTVFLYLTIGISYKRTYDNVFQLDTKDNRAMLWLVRILIQNGLCLPATWLTIATCLNTTDVIIYKDSFGIEIPLMRDTLGVEDASTVMLSILFAIIMVWFVLDNFLLEKYTRYTFTVFPVFILGLSGVVAKLRYKDAERNLILASVILGFSVLALLVRIVLFLYRLKKRMMVVEEKNNIMESQQTVVKL